MTTFQKIIIPLVVLLIAGWFYWFQYRPSRVKQLCTKSAAESFKHAFDSADSRDDNPNDGLVDSDDIQRFRKNMDQNYDLCLHSKGL